MKNKTYIGYAAILLIFGVFVVRNFNHHIEPRGKELDNLKNSQKSNSTLSYFEVNGKTRKMPHFAFTNQDNQIISELDYKNKVYVVDFFFTSCPTICPIMTQNLKTIDKAIGKNEKFGIVSVTIDPRHDNPMVLKQYAEKYQINNLNWNFLTGNQNKIHQLANKGLNIFAGINPKVAGGFEHQGFFALVDQQGFLRSRNDQYGNPIIFYQGTKPSEVKNLIEDINILLKE